MVGRDEAPVHLVVVFVVFVLDDDVVVLVVFIVLVFIVLVFLVFVFIVFSCFYYCFLFFSRLVL